MSYEARKIGEVENGEVYEVCAPLDEQLQAFQRVGINTLGTPEQVAQIRLTGISNNWSRTNVAPIAIKGAKTILVKNSPLMNPLMAVLAVDAHRKGEYLALGKELYEQAQAIAQSQTGIEPEDRTAIAVSQDGDFNLKVTDNEVRFLLEKSAQPYFAKFVRGGDKGEVPFYNLQGTSKDKALVNYMWFDVPQCESSFGCRVRYLEYDDRAFGVLGNGVASARKNGYSLTEIANANSEIIPVVFEQAKASGIAAGIFSRQLNKSLLDRLRKGKQ